MDKESRAKDLIKLAERFRSRKIGNTRKRLNFGDENFSLYSNYELGMDPCREYAAQQAKDLEEKYNFSFVEERPKEGGFEWETVKPDDPKSKDVPDFYFRPPHQKRSAFGNIDLLQQTVTTSRDPLNPLNQTTASLPAPTTGSNKALHRQHTPQNTTASTSSTVSSAASLGTSPANRQLFLDSTETIITPTCHSPTLSQRKNLLSDRQPCLGGEDCLIFADTQLSSIQDGDVTGNSVTEPSFSPLQFWENGSGSNNHNKSLSSSLPCEKTIPSPEGNSEDKTLLNPATFSIISQKQSGDIEKQGNSSEVDTQETPVLGNGAANMKRTQITDYYPQKKKCVSNVKRRLYEEDK